MRFIAIVAALIGLTCAAAVDVFPGTSIKLFESEPWHITHLVVFEAKNKKEYPSYIHFHFEDINKDGLALNTTCFHVVPAGSNDTLSSSQYQECDSDYVKFIYSGNKLQLEHLYIDNSLGDPPYNHAIAFGHGSFNLTKTKTELGVLKTQTEMHIPITSMSG